MGEPKPGWRLWGTGQLQDKLWVTSIDLGTDMKVIFHQMVEVDSIPRKTWSVRCGASVGTRAYQTQPGRPKWTQEFLWFALTLKRSQGPKGWCKTSVETPRVLGK